MALRTDAPSRSRHASCLSEDHRDGASDQAGSRLNLLLSYGGWRDHPAVDQLDRLLRPLGINSVRADSGEEAADIIRRMAIHIAVVDLAIPLHAPADAEGESDGEPAREPPAKEPGGGRILQLLRRLDPAPPTVIVRPPQPAARENVRGLAEALRDGAFAVVDRPVNLETMLEVMRRVLSRHYSDHWPAS